MLHAVQKDRKSLQLLCARIVSVANSPALICLSQWNNEEGANERTEGRAKGGRGLDIKAGVWSL